MSTIIGNRNFLLFISLIVTFGVIAWYSPFIILYETVAGLAIGVTFAVFLLYMPVASRVFVVKRMSSGEQLAAGICCMALGTFLNRSFNLLWRIQNPDYNLPIINSDFVNFTIFLIVLGGVLHTTVPDLNTGEIKPRNWAFLILSIVIGAVITGGIIGYGLGVRF